MYMYMYMYMYMCIYISITKLLNDACGPWESRQAWPIDVSHRASLNGRLGRPSHAESPALLDRGASSGKSRPTRVPGRSRDAIFDDSGSILGGIFVVFRGCFARSARLAARRAEPLFLLAGVVRNRDFAFKKKSMKIVEKSLRQACGDQLCGKKRDFFDPVVNRRRF